MTRSLTTVLLAGLAASASAQVTNFAPPRVFAIPPGSLDASPNYVAAGDIDGDGDIDLVTDSNGPGGDPTQVFWNDGSGEFTLGPVLTAGWGFGGVALGDLEGDGDLDVVRCSYFSHGAYFFRNGDDAGFDPGFYYSGGGGCVDVIFTDIDGDGDDDFILTDNFGGQVRPYRNISGLGFNSVGLFPAGTHPYALAAGDVDGDGDNDLVAANDDGNSMTVMFNDGTGAFTGAQAYPMGRARGIALADFNGDGALDAVTSDFYTALGALGDEVSVRLGHGDGTFGPRAGYRTQALPEDVGVADFNGDGNLDLVVTCGVDDSMVVLRGNGDGTFMPFEAFDAYSDPQGLALGDFDGDGDTDVATVSNSLDRLVILDNVSGTPTDPDDLEIAWHAGHDNLFNEDIATHLVVGPDASVIAAGSTYFTSNENDFHLVKFDAQGNELWQATYNGVGDHYDNIDAMVLDQDGNVIVTGESWNNDFGTHWATVKWDAAGQHQWTRIYQAANTFSQQRPADLAVNGSGQVAVCGYYIDDQFDAKFAVAAYDADGTPMWDTKAPAAAGSPNGGQALAVTFDNSGDIVAVGLVDDDDEFGEEGFVVKFDPSGSVVWSRRHDATTADIFNETTFRAVHTDAARNVYAAGYAWQGDTSADDFVIVKYDADGNHRWDHTSADLGALNAMAITELDDGTIVVSGSGGDGVVLLAWVAR